MTLLFPIRVTGNANAIYANISASISQAAGATTLVSATTSRAVFASSLVDTSQAGTITISGGTVQSAGTSKDYPTIEIYNPDNKEKVNITITGGTVQNTGAGGVAVKTPGSVQVTGGTVKATSGTAICSTSTSDYIEVRGGIVQATTGTAIDGANYVNVSNGTVQATGDGGVAIKAVTTPTINQSPGGTTLVSATTGTAIISATPITVNGGTVRATTGNAIVATSSSAQTVAVTGGVVMNQSATSPAIKFDNPGTGIAEVTGGLVFSWGTTVEDIVGLSGFAPTGKGVAVAWDTTTGTDTYTAFTDTQLFMLPTGSAHWANNAQGQSGVAYTSGTNTGFLPLAGVTVQKITLAASSFSHSITDVAYNGAAQGFAVTPAAPLTADITGAITVYYTGVNGTVYPKSTTAPANAGSYAVSIDAAGGANANAASGLLLGNYTIGKLPLAITGVVATARTYDGTTTVALTGGTLQGMAAPDQNAPARLGIALGSGTAVDAGVGTGKAVNTSIALTGTAAGNYTFTQPTGIMVDITQRPLTLRANRVDVQAGEAIPTLTYTVENLAPGEPVTNAIATAPTLAHDVVDTNVLGVYTITLAGGTATANYTIVARESSILTISNYHYIDDSGNAIVDALPSHTNKAADYSVRLNAPHSSFFDGTRVIGEVLVDDDLLTPGIHYTHAEGSTIITLKASYLQTLTNDTYTLTVRFADGAASLPFTVDVKTPEPTPDPKPEDDGTQAQPGSTSPQTGDSSSMGLWVVLVIFSAAILAAGVVCLRKKRQPDGKVG